MWTKESKLLDSGSQHIDYEKSTTKSARMNATKRINLW